MVLQRENILKQYALTVSRHGGRRGVPALASFPVIESVIRSGVVNRHARVAPAFQQVLGRDTVRERSRDHRRG